MWIEVNILEKLQLPASLCGWESINGIHEDSCETLILLAALLLVSVGVE